MTAVLAAPARVRHISRSRRRRYLVGGLVAACAVMTFVSLMIGAVVFSPTEVIKAVTGNGTGQSSFVITSFQLPRVLLCWVVGIGLAVSGGVMQGVIRNPLAAPNINPYNPLIARLWG